MQTKFVSIFRAFVVCALLSMTVSCGSKSSELQSDAGSDTAQLADVDAITGEDLARPDVVSPDTTETPDLVADLHEVQVHEVQDEVVVGCQSDDECAAENPPGTCMVAVCEVATGLCSEQPEVDGTVCDDGIQCTSDDGCVAGVCSGDASACCGNGACDVMETCETCFPDCDCGPNTCPDIKECAAPCTDDACAANCSSAGSPFSQSLFSQLLNCAKAACGDYDSECFDKEFAADGKCYIEMDLCLHADGVCGNSICEPMEECMSCPYDCGNCAGGSCSDIMACKLGCGGDLGCVDGCVTSASASGQAVYNVMTDCITGACGGVGIDDICESQAVTQGPCADPFNACWADTTVCGDGTCETGETCSSCSEDCGVCPLKDCVDSLTCIRNCGSDSVCVDTCKSLEEPDAAIPLNALLDCLVTQCGTLSDSSCFTEVCGPGGECFEWLSACEQQSLVCGDHVCEVNEACSNCPGDCGYCVNATCYQILECQGTCGTDTGCADLCLATGSANSQALVSAFLQCVTDMCGASGDQSCIQGAVQGPCKDEGNACMGDTGA